MNREKVMQWACAISRSDVIAPRTLIRVCRLLYGGPGDDAVTLLAAGLRQGPRALASHAADLLARQKGGADVLIDALRQADENVTAEVLRVIATQFIEASGVGQYLTLREAVERALSSADPAARRQAVKVATFNEMVDLSGRLARLAERDRYPEVRIAALNALQRMGCDEEIPALTRITRQQGVFGKAARRALAAVRQRMALIAAA